MLPIIRTRRLILRPRDLRDLESCIAMDSDPEVMRYVGGMPADPRTHAEWLVRRIGTVFPAGLGYWSLVPEENPAGFLGWVCLIPADDADSRSPAEIGWRVVRQAWGRGYAPEAAAALLRHAFGTLGLDRVIATAHPSNTQSFRVAEKIGLAPLGDSDYFGEPCKLYEARPDSEPVQPIAPIA
ncbi:GNAT family N-acetyltransferase [Arenibaculum pallidiluteum]|uniref:GNAT family N-acetyltransferase n=1 Tax=Arenibaculum pallidiluteum TaxID=2812559 RepID=UPI001A973964|nr:GNAT family N-acetyltransferase [Arenibaculum pallidiluteum]